ncbi:hypothetical protein ACTJJB_22575 [Chitinophaga sp. 22536]|uniref:hypothetical protein n=1 Tax=unclassified Chitinophaga TaxID=2619133 RepID=UPI003F877B5F
MKKEKQYHFWDKSKCPLSRLYIRTREDILTIQIVYMKDKKNAKKIVYKEGLLEVTETNIYKEIVTYFIKVQGIQGKMPKNRHSSQSIRKFFVAQLFGLKEESAQSHCSEKLERLNVTGKMVTKFIKNIGDFFKEIPSFIEQWEAYKKLPKREMPTTSAKILTNLSKLNEYTEIKKIFDDWKKVIDATLMVKPKPKGENDDNAEAAHQNSDKKMNFQMEIYGDCRNMIDVFSFTNWTIYSGESYSIGRDSSHIKVTQSYSLSFLGKRDNQTLYFQLYNHQTTISVKGIATCSSCEDRWFLKCFDNSLCFEIAFNWLTKVFGKNLIAQCSMFLGKGKRKRQLLSFDSIAHCGLGSSFSTMLADFSYRNRCGTLTKTEKKIFDKLKNIDIDFLDTPVIQNDLRHIILENPVHNN